MGFFKNIFKKKEGGTMFGNLIRGGASAMTGGLLGSGAGLAKWEAEQRNKVHALPAMSTNAIMPSPNQGFDVGQNLVNEVFVPAAANGGGNNPKVGESVVLETIKNNWYWVLGFILAIIGFTWYISKPKGNNRLRLKK